MYQITSQKLNTIQNVHHLELRQYVFFLFALMLVFFHVKVKHRKTKKTTCCFKKLSFGGSKSTSLEILQLLARRTHELLSEYMVSPDFVSFSLRQHLRKAYTTYILAYALLMD